MTEEERLTKALHNKKVEEVNSLFETIYKNYYGLVVFVIRSFTNSSSNVEDIAQDTFVDFFNNAANVHSSIKSYLIKMAKNKCLDYLKKEQRFVNLNTDELEYIRYLKNQEQDIYQEINLNELIENLRKQLSEEEVTIILLHLLDDFDFKTIGIKLNQKEKTVKTKYYRALKKFKKNGGMTL